MGGASGRGAPAWLGDARAQRGAVVQSGRQRGGRARRQVLHFGRRGALRRGRGADGSGGGGALPRAGGGQGRAPLPGHRGPGRGAGAPLRRDALSGDLRGRRGPGAADVRAAPRHGEAARAQRALRPGRPGAVLLRGRSGERLELHHPLRADQRARDARADCLGLHLGLAGDLRGRPLRVVRAPQGGPRLPALGRLRRPCMCVLRGGCGGRREDRGGRRLRHLALHEHDVPHALRARAPGGGWRGQRGRRVLRGDGDRRRRCRAAGDGRRERPHVHHDGLPGTGRLLRGDRRARAEARAPAVVQGCRGRRQRRQQRHKLSLRRQCLGDAHCVCVRADS
mmetsp:Transcript_56514/g.148618  ORF Transcript_56514/g.148618 Transcript_56514/m.148618 type:complete len:338 (-) Transcript_56514:12-1025(-)